MKFVCLLLEGPSKIPPQSPLGAPIPNPHFYSAITTSIALIWSYCNCPFTVVPPYLKKIPRPQNPQWMPQTVCSTKSYICHVLSYTYIPEIKFNL